MNRLKEIRESRGFSRKYLATLAGCTDREIDYIERGMRTPNVLLALRIAESLAVTVEEIFK